MFDLVITYGVEAMIGRVLPQILVATVIITLGGCAVAQMTENATEMVDSLQRLRQKQVLSNLAASINDHDFVPSQIVLGTGQSNVSIGTTPTLKFPGMTLSSKSKEIDLAATDTWTAQWQMTAVVDATDLRNLRNLYAFVTSTDEQYATLQKYLSKHEELEADCSPQRNLSDGVSAGAAAVRNNKWPQDHGKPMNFIKTCSQSAALGPSSDQTASWPDVIQAIEIGDSIGCKIFQESVVEGFEHKPPQTKTGIPFHRWLYWKHPGDRIWQPDNIPQNENITVLGTYGGWQLASTSLACFDDFTILVQQATPATHNASAGGAKVIE